MRVWGTGGTTSDSPVYIYFLTRYKDRLKMSNKKSKVDKKRVRGYSSNDEESEMLAAIAKYHGNSKSGILVGFIRKEFWRVFPNGTGKITAMTK